MRLSLSSYNSSKPNSLILSLDKKSNNSFSGSITYSLPRLKLYIFLSIPTLLSFIALIIFSGQVIELYVKTGDQVESGSDLMKIE